MDMGPEFRRNDALTAFPAPAAPLSLKDFFKSLPEDVRKPAVNVSALVLPTLLGPGTVGKVDPNAMTMMAITQGFAAVCAGTAAVVVATPIESIKVGIQTWKVGQPTSRSFHVG